MEVKFHDIGEGMNEGEIVNYFVKVGDQVTVDQPLVEMQTDKMVAEIPSPAAGTVQEIFFQPGETVHVGTVIMKIDNQERRMSHKRIIAAPRTRKLAREHDIDIEQVKGTGRAGRVTDEDIYHLMKSRDKEEISAAELADEARTETVESGTIAFTGIRKAIAKKMSHSLQTIPHVTHFDEVDLTNVMELRNELKEMGNHISIVAFFIKATAIALKEYPVFNARLDEKNEVIRLSKAYNIGIATDTEAGLLVPVLQHVEKKSLCDIHLEMKVLTKKAQEGKLTGQDMKDGTFTISNVGPLGGSGATPIINHPETGIFSFHKTKKTPVVLDNDEIVIRSVMNLSFSFDHRVADGALAVRFTNRFIELIESPVKLMVELK